MSFFARAYLGGRIDYAFDVTAFVTSPFIWKNKLIAFLLFGLISSFPVFLMKKTLYATVTDVNESEARYRALMDNMDVMIINLTADSKILAVNKACSRALGFKEEDILGKDFFRVLKLADSSLWREKISQTLRELKGIEFQYDYKGDNRTAVFKVKLLPQFDGEETLTSVLVTAVDITEQIESRQRIEALLKDENRNLENLVKERTAELEETMNELVEREKLASLGSLVAGISHEVNTPLGVAVSAGSYITEQNNIAFEKLREGKFSKQSLVQYLKTMDETSEIINANLNKASDLIKSFKQISVNQSMEEKLSFNLPEYIRSVLKTLKHEYKKTKHTIEVVCDDALVINSYPGVFSQILTNFIMNSLLHGFSDEEEGLMRIEVQKEKDSLILIYSDNGKGIREEDQKRIFDPFFTTGRERGGSGLGLSIIYNLIRGKLNGSVSCYSTWGEGTDFFVVIPAEEIA